MANIKKKPEFEESTLGANPFMVNEVLRARKITTEESTVRKVADGINLRAGTQVIENLFEQKKYAKIFEDAAYRDHVVNLPYPAMRLWFFIIYQVENGKDWFWFNRSLYRKVTKLRGNSDIQVAVELLERYGFIYPTKYPDVYWINSMIAFKGDRLKKHSKNVSVD